ncbi:MAG: hypothetical protein ACLFM0_05350 [Spirochaetales bacterium]
MRLLVYILGHTGEGNALTVIPIHKDYDDEMKRKPENALDELAQQAIDNDVGH